MIIADGYAIDGQGRRYGWDMPNRVYRPIGHDGPVVPLDDFESHLTLDHPTISFATPGLNGDAGTTSTGESRMSHKWRDRSLPYPCCEKMTEGKYDGVFGAHWEDCPEHGHDNSCYLCASDRGEYIQTCETCPGPHYRNQIKMTT